MPLVDRVVALADEMRAWRHHLHAHPETAFQEHQTADFVAEKLKAFGLDVHRGLAKTGVVGTLRSGNSNRAIGLRADMDALDLVELNEFAHRSRHEGKMHGCGHDGHTTMLLGAAQALSEQRGFNGTVHFIFQPAEENEAGGRVMVQEGLFDRFPVESVYGMHNMPGVELGKIALRPGAMMASADFFFVKISGVGTHGAMPHKGVDPMPIAAEIVLALQTVVARYVDPIEPAVVSVTKINGGFTTNVIPEAVELCGTTRAFSTKVQDVMERRIRDLCEGIAKAHGAVAEVRYERRYPPTVNSVDETEIAALAAADTIGADNVLRNRPPTMGSEDFGWMLLERPGCYVWLGNGTGAEGGCMVHNPRYDFNDEALKVGASYWVRLVERLLPKAGAGLDGARAA